MSNYYNGYAQDKDWSIRIDDPSKRIRARGIQQLQYMEADLKWNAQQSDRWLQAMRQNVQLEAQNRSENFQLRQKFNRMFAEADWNQKKSHIDRAKGEHDKARQWQKDLLAFTKTGSAFLAQQEAERKQTVQALWKDHANKWGLNPQIVEQVNQVKSEAWKNDMQSQNIYKTLAAKGVPDDVIRSLHGLGQYGQIAIAENHAIERSRQLGVHYEKYAHEPIQIGDQSTTFAAAHASGDPRLLGEVMRQLKLKVDEEYGGSISAKVKETSGAWQIEQQIDAEFYRTQRVAAQKAGIRENAKRIESIFKNQLNQINPVTGLKVHPGAAFLKMIEHDAGGPDASGESKRAARLALNSTISAGLAEGFFDVEDIAKINDYVFTPDGSTKPTTIGAHWQGEAFARDRVVKARLIEDQKLAEIETQKYKVKKSAFLSDTYAIVYPEDGSEVDQETLMNRFKAAVQLGYEDSANLIQKRLALNGASGINDAAGRLRVQQKIREGHFIPSNYTTDLNLTPPVKTEMDALIAKHNRTSPTGGEHGTAKLLRAELLNLLETKVPSRNSFSKIPGSSAALQSLYEESVVWYKAHIRKHGFDTHNDALQYARDMAEKEVSKPTSRWRLEHNKDLGIRDFVGFRANKDRAAIKTDIVPTIKAVQKDVSYLDNNSVIERDLVYDHYQAIKEGRGTADIPIALILENQALVPSHVTLEKQRNYYNSNLEPGQLEIPEPPDDYLEKIDSSRSEIAPALRYKLGLNNPTEINAAYAGSQKPLPYIDSPISFARNSIPNTLGITYNNIDDGRSDVDSDGFNLTDLTINEVLALGDNRYGAFKLDSNRIESSLDGAGLKGSDKFNKTNQNKIFELLFRTEGLLPWLEDLQRPLIDGTTIADPETMDQLTEAYEALTKPFEPRSSAWVRPELQQYMRPVNV